MRTHTIAILSCLVSLGLSAARCPAQESPKPGPEHALLKQHEGTWDAAIKMVADPNNPAESKGAMICKMDLGGLWLISDFKTDDFSGHGVSTYDPVAKKYSGVWVDSMSTSIMRMQGEFDKAGKVLTESGEMTGPDGKPVKFKMVTEFKDKDTHQFRMAMVGSDGKDQPMIEIVYRRKK